MNTEINEKLKTLPDKSGVYIMKSDSGEIIYVGKAKNLKNRVRTYFKSHNHPPKVASMVSNVSSFEYIITDSELEALVLENNLIKENMPKYNILLKDDKTYPFLKITVNESFPRIYMTRKVIKDGAMYFGPYQSSQDLKQLIALVKDIFCIRSCSAEYPDDFEPKRPCLYYQLGKCKGVCNRQITKYDYNVLINKAIEFINGNTSSVTQELTKQMHSASEAFDFEKAAILRDRLKSIEVLSQKQKIVNPRGTDFDAVAVYNKNNTACVQIFFMRSGKLIGREHYFMENTDLISDGEILAEFIRSYYENATFIPNVIYVECQIDDSELLSQWVSQKASGNVKIKVPKIGDNAKLMKMIKANAGKEHSENELRVLRDVNFKNSSLSELQKLLGLNNPPMLMEAYDISNLGDENIVASMVVYKDGKPCSKKYKNFKIKSLENRDDYSSMREVISRRIKRAVNESKRIENGEIMPGDANFLPYPDVIFVDGGEGHRRVASKVVEEYKLSIPVFGIVKDDNHRTRGVVGENGEIVIDRKCDSFMLLTNIQDEMHRRAITYLRKSQQKKVTGSELDLIPGIGPKRKQELIRHFKSVSNIKKASVDMLSRVKGIDTKTAENIYNYFNPKSKQ